MKAILAKFEAQTAPVLKQLAKVRGLTPPQYGTLSEWTRARRRAAAGTSRGTAANKGSDPAAKASAAAEASTSTTSRTPPSRSRWVSPRSRGGVGGGGNPAKAQPEWLKGSVYVDDDQTNEQSEGRRREGDGGETG